MKNPHQIACGERDIHQSELLEMGKVVDGNMKKAKQRRYRTDYGANPMNKDELVEKLHQIYVSEKLERIMEVVSEIPERVLGPIHEITKGDNAPPGSNRIPARGEYKDETKTVILYEDVFCRRVLIHEIGHSIYHECPEIAEITNREYAKKEDIFRVLETRGEGLSENEGAAEFCANAYQLYKTGTISIRENPERFRSLAEKLEEEGV